MKCQNCGGDITSEDKFCMHCGIKIEQTVSVSSNDTVNNNVENINYEIKGELFPLVEFNLKTGDKIISESGAMAWKDSSITMETTSDGGFKKVIGRLLSNEKLFHNIYTATKDESKIAFVSCIPGAIKAIEKLVRSINPYISHPEASNSNSSSSILNTIMKINKYY